MSFEREPDPWPARLAGDERDAATAELRVLLFRGLARALRGRSGVDDAFLDDAVQEALLKILAGLTAFEGRSRFTTWAMAIAVRVALTHQRRKHWSDVSLESMSARGELDPAIAIDPAVGPQQRHAQQAIFDELRRQMACLTDRQRTVIQAELAELPQDEIARHLGTTRNAVYKLAHDARRRLQQGLQQAGYSDDDIMEAFS